MLAYVIEYSATFLHISCPIGACAGKSKVCASLTILMADAMPSLAGRIQQCSKHRRMLLCSSSNLFSVVVNGCLAVLVDTRFLGHARYSVRTMDEEMPKTKQDKAYDARASTRLTFRNPDTDSFMATNRKFEAWPLAGVAEVAPRRLHPSVELQRHPSLQRVPHPHSLSGTNNSPSSCEQRHARWESSKLPFFPPPNQND